MLAHLGRTILLDKCSVWIYDNLRDDDWSGDGMGGYIVGL